MSLPCLAVRRSIASSAASVATIRSAIALLLGSEEAERLGVIADQQALGLAVVLEHHLVVLAADARGVVAAERRVGGVLVLAVVAEPAPRRAGRSHKPQEDCVTVRADIGATARPVGSG